MKSDTVNAMKLKVIQDVKKSRVYKREQKKHITDIVHSLNSIKDLEEYENYLDLQEYVIIAQGDHWADIIKARKEEIKEND